MGTIFIPTTTVGHSSDANALQVETGISEVQGHTWWHIDFEFSLDSKIIFTTMYLSVFSLWFYFLFHVWTGQVISSWWHLLMSFSFYRYALQQQGPSWSNEVVFCKSDNCNVKQAVVQRTAGVCKMSPFCFPNCWLAHLWDLFTKVCPSGLYWIISGWTGKFLITKEI